MQQSDLSYRIRLSAQDGPKSPIMNYRKSSHFAYKVDLRLNLVPKCNKNLQAWYLKSNYSKWKIAIMATLYTPFYDIIFISQD